MEQENESLKIGTELGNGQFVIDKLLAKGGFSYIYEGRIIYKVSLTNQFVKIQTAEKPVVIKELYISNSSYRSDDGLSLKWNDENESDENKRLSARIKNKTRNEALKLAGLTSRYILRILGAIEENNTIYQITEKIEGSIDFSKKLDLSLKHKGKMLKAEEATRYILQISEALKEVHSKNIVHLDIKPENILCDYKNDAILIDFGISMTIGENKGGSTLLPAASRPWAPPEQYNIKENIPSITFATDIYSLGQTFYAFLTGVIPPDSTNISSGSEILQPPSVFNDGVNDYLDEVVMKCIEIRRDKRYQTIDEFLIALNGENDFNKIIRKAKEYGENKDYENGIRTLNESERYIPLTAKLLELRYEFQSRLKEQQKEGENRRLEKKAQHLIDENRFEEAIQILELLPDNKNIQQLILKCKQKNNEKEKNALIASAEKCVENKEFQPALHFYQEAKLLDQSDFAIDKKIEELQKVLEEIEKNERYNEFIRKGDDLFKNKQYNAALDAYLKAKENVTISSQTVDNKINASTIALEKINQAEADKQELIKALNEIPQLLSIHQISRNNISKLFINATKITELYTEYKKKHKNDTTFDEKIKENLTNREALADMQKFYDAEDLFEKKEYDRASELLSGIETVALSLMVNELKNKIYHIQSETEDKKNDERATYALSKKRYEEAITYLKKINATDKYNVIERIIEVENKQSTDRISNLIRLKRFNEAEKEIKEISSDLLRVKLSNQLTQQKIDTARNYIDENAYQKAWDLLIDMEGNNEANRLMQDINEKIKKEKDDTHITNAKTLINEGNFDEAKKTLNKIELNSDRNEDKTTLLYEIDDKENFRTFDVGEKAFKAAKYNEAIVALKMIPESSNFYTRAKSLIAQSEEILKNKDYERKLSEVKSFIDAKKYKKAKSKLAALPENTVVESERQHLEVALNNHIKSKSSFLKKTLKIIGIGAVAIIILFSLIDILSNNERVNPDELLNNANNFTLQALRINNEKFPSETDSVVFFFKQAIDCYRVLEGYEDYKKEASDKLTTIEEKIDKYINNNENDKKLNMEYSTIYNENIIKLKTLKRDNFILR